MKRINLSSLKKVGKLPAPLFVSIKNIGKGIKMPNELHLVRITFILRDLYPGLLFSNDSILRINEGPFYFEANGAIYEFCSLDFDPEWKDTDRAKSQGGWIFLRLRVHAFISQNNGMAIVSAGNESPGTIFNIPLSEEDVEIFEIEKFTER